MPPRPPALERAALATGALRVEADGRVLRVRRYGRPCTPRAADSAGPHGYRVVPLRIPGVGYRNLLAHRLVYEARVGPIPDGWVVRQRNGQPADNRPANLIAAPRPASGRRPRAATCATDTTGVSDPSGGGACSGGADGAAATLNTSVPESVSVGSRSRAAEGRARR